MRDFFSPQSRLPESDIFCAESALHTPSLSDPVLRTQTSGPYPSPHRHLARVQPTLPNLWITARQPGPCTLTGLQGRVRGRCRGCRDNRLLQGCRRANTGGLNLTGENKNYFQNKVAAVWVKLFFTTTDPEARLSVMMVDD